ncbi:restriction endonuclease subunit S [Psychrobacter raelei]|uniref:restriction endonuclease subunit S n=1 Tax=Psychrobacter raelei TaxID=2565531 RepID=UPI003F63D9C1
MVPNGWNKLSLQELVSINYGKSPKEIIDENGIYDIVGTGGITGSTNSYLHSGPSVIIGRKGTIDKPQFLKKPFWAIDTTFYCLPLDSKKLDMNWFYQLSQVIDWRRYNEASGVPSLSRGTIYSIKVPTPPIQEQQIIVKILTTWDKAIDTTERLIDNSKQQKKALMQQLLTGKKRLLDDNGKRFEGEWKRIELGKLLDYEQPTKYLVKSTEYSDEYSTPVLTAGKTFILGYTNEDFGIFEENLPTIIFDDFTTASKFVDFPFKAKSSAMKMLIAKEGVSIKFVYEAMQVMNFPVGGHKRHWISTFSNLTIPLPTLKEQQKIAAVLTNADKEIELLEQQLADLQQEKKALMQVLLTGKKRVKVA